MHRSDSANSQRKLSNQQVTSAVNHFYDKRYTVALEKVRNQYHHTARLYEIKSGSRCSSRQSSQSQNRSHLKLSQQLADSKTQRCRAASKEINRQNETIFNRIMEIKNVNRSVLVTFLCVETTAALAGTRQQPTVPWRARISVPNWV